MIQFSTAERSARDRQRTLQAVFESQYAWLLRWAMHFTGNDRAAAEDLVQETFVRLLLAWDTLRDLDDLEPLLYSYLRYTHLSEQRNSQRQALARLSSADFDTLAVTLRSASIRTAQNLDQIEVQNELRSILDFLLWRKQSARFASMFLLRFFHGYFPEEIASICLAKRFSVDLGLRQARRELKTHLADPHRLRVLGRAPFAEQKPIRIAVPMEQFEEELRLRIFQWNNGACPSPEEFECIYSAQNPRGMETGVLAHVVACEHCLDNVSRRSGAPPPTARSMDESLSRAPRSISKKNSATVKQKLARIFAEGENRMREIYEHRPTELMIALNAQVVAVRDIDARASRATLKVETHSVQTLELIEIFSEDGLLLLSMPITSRPPKSDPEIHHAVQFSEDRMLSLAVRFTRDGALIEATYEDPHGARECEEFEQVDAPVAMANSKAGAMPDAPPRMRGLSGLRRLLDGLLQHLTKTSVLVPGMALLSGLVLFLVLTVVNHERQRTDANQLLRAAVRAESVPPESGKSGAILQRIQIRTSGHAAQRNLYRDPAGKRKAKELSLSEDERILRMKFAEAKLDWDDPLSAQGFRDWHDQLYQQEDRVTRTGQNLLTVSTEAKEGAIAAETLTVEAGSLHTVARSVRLRDGETVEVAELSYEAIPWGPEVEQWFEPLAATSSAVHPASHVVPMPAAPPLTDEQLDVAELSAQKALQDLHADTERLELARSPSGVTVKGVVETEERKTEIAGRLHAIPHVDTAIASYRDLQSGNAQNGTVTSLQEVSVSDGDTPLKGECKKKLMSEDACRQIGYALLSASSVLVRESRRIHDLQTQYPQDKPLTQTSVSLLAAIARERLGHMQAALDEQEKALRSLSDELPEKENTPSGTPFLADAAQRNLTLSKELIYSSNGSSRPGPIIVHDLTMSIRAVREMISHESSEFQSRMGSTSVTVTTKQQ
jgi:RNA polymerase sigma factor (sigma-70 family)